MAEGDKLNPQSISNGYGTAGEPHSGSRATVLAIRNLLFDISDPEWFYRDRIVLSYSTEATLASNPPSIALTRLAGHASMLFCVMTYLVGYNASAIDELKDYGGALEGVARLSKDPRNKGIL
ncbi:hypothetical protein B0J12DRAFT_751501 [Macrophomina phaseolina]|uniref:Uncharacterized protein n=1 Tax=Macrophomina phaseolina TaxID=35725 RepID=A0ABQ8GCF1_9PEZI|nr:hypothetical protein B0J12DRAFT_751501 [Macrophomina phaseolina]